jgi:protein-tyrosine phosphatase
LQSAGAEFASFPVADRGVPGSVDSFSELVTAIGTHLGSGTNVGIHCRQSIGRAGLLAAALLIACGVPPERAMDRASAARGCVVPETAEQRRWLVDFASLHSAPAAKVAGRC